MKTHPRGGEWRRQRERGFTLIELLVVVTIIGILAAIVSVSVAGVTLTAETNAKKTKVGSVQVAVDVFNANNNTGAWPVEAAAISNRACAPVTAVGGDITSATVFYDGKGATFTCSPASLRVLVVNIWGTSPAGLVAGGFLRPQGATGAGTLTSSSTANGFQCILETDPPNTAATIATKGKLLACTEQLVIQ